MATSIRRVDYFYTTVRDEPGEAHKLLMQLADLGVNLLALTGVPVGPSSTQFTLFPADGSNLMRASEHANIKLDGPHGALLVQGDDRLGALTEIHSKLAAASVNVFASSGVTDGRGSYGYILYIRPDDYDRATAALDV